MTAFPRFLGYEIDADGHAYQRLALGEESLALYPILAPISLEHSLEVERTILPAIVALYESDPEQPAFAAFRAFFTSFQAIRRGDGQAAALLGEVEARVLEAVRAAINDFTPDDQIERRAFACFYRQATCDNDGYREKALRSLNELVARASEIDAGK